MIYDLYIVSLCIMVCGLPTLHVVGGCSLRIRIVKSLMPIYDVCVCVCAIHIYVDNNDDDLIRVEKISCIE